MTDAEQAARLAAIRAKRGQAPVATRTAASPAMPLPPPTVATSVSASAPAPSPMPAVAGPPTVAATGRTTQPVRRGRRPHIAAGARSVVTGLTGSAIFGLTTIIAAANAPTAATAPVPTVGGAAPTAVVVPVSIVPTDVGVSTIPAAGNGAAPQVETVVLTLPTLATTASSAGTSSVGTSAAAPAAGNAPAPVNSTPVTSAPRPATPAPTTTVATPVTVPPPPPPTTTAPSK